MIAFLCLLYYTLSHASRSRTHQQQRRWRWRWWGRRRRRRRRRMCQWRAKPTKTAATAATAASANHHSKCTNTHNIRVSISRSLSSHQCIFYLPINWPPYEPPLYTIQTRTHSTILTFFVHEFNRFPFYVFFSHRLTAHSIAPSHYLFIRIHFH